MGNDRPEPSTARAADLALALGGLPVARKSSRLYALWPAIEKTLAQGVSHAQVLEFLNEQGFALTERTYKSYIYRFRKRHRDRGLSAAPPDGSKSASQFGAMPRPLPSCGSAAAMNGPVDTPLKAQDTPLPNGMGRPPTFEFNPAGISPDLLK